MAAQRLAQCLWLALGLLYLAQANGITVNFLNNLTKRGKDEQHNSWQSNRCPVEPEQKVGGLTRGGRRGRDVQEEACQTSNLSDGCGANTSSKTYTIAARDFVKLAQQIAGCLESLAQVPQTFLSAISRAIAVRKNHGQRLWKIGYEKDDGHQHFITVLERVRDILHPQQLESAAATGPSTPAGHTEKASNRLESLVVEESSDGFLEQSTGTPKAPTAIHYEAEHDDFEEASLAFQLLLEDYCGLLEVVRKSWEGYHSGIFDLVVVTLTTNTAIDLACRFEADVQRLFDKSGGSEVLLPRFLHAWMEKSSAHPDEEIGQAAESVTPFGQARSKGKGLEDDSFVLESRFWPVYKTLRDFNDSVQIDGRRALESDRSKRAFRSIEHNLETDSNDSEVQNELTLLYAALCQLFILLTVGGHWPRDEFFASLGLAIERNKISAAFVFSALVYLETNRVLSSQKSEIHNEVQDLGKSIRSSLTELGRLHNGVHNPYWVVGGITARLTHLLRWSIRISAIRDPSAGKKKALSKAGIDLESHGNSTSTMWYNLHHAETILLHLRYCSRQA